MRNLRITFLKSGIHILSIEHHKSHGHTIMIESHLAPGLILLDALEIRKLTAEPL